MNRLSAVLAVLVVGLLAPAVLLAQDTLPTKTPTPMPNLEPSDEEAPDDVATARFEITDPYIQADLSVLSGNVQRPNGLFWHDGMVYASCNGDWTLYEINAETGATVTYLWGIRNAHTIFAEDDAAGDLNLWVPDFQTNSLMRVYQRQAITVVDGLAGPWGIDQFDDERFLVSNLLENTLVLIDRSGNVDPIATGLRSPAGVAVDGDFVYVANNGSARRAIEWYATGDIAGAPLDTSVEGVAQPLVSGLQNTTGIQLGADGYLYFAYSLGTRGVVGRVDPVECRDGGCSVDQVEIVLYTDLPAPLAGLTLSPEMDLYIHTIFSPDLYTINLNEGGTQTVRR